MTLEEREEQDFIKNGTTMAKTTREMFHYESSLLRINDLVNEDKELSVDDRFLLYNFLQDLKFYRKFFHPDSEEFKRRFEQEVS